MYASNAQGIVLHADRTRWLHFIRAVHILAIQLPWIAGGELRLLSRTHSGVRRICCPAPNSPFVVGRDSGLRSTQEAGLEGFQPRRQVIAGWWFQDGMRREFATLECGRSNLSLNGIADARGAPARDGGKLECPNPGASQADSAGCARAGNKGPQSSADGSMIGQAELGRGARVRVGQ